MKRTDKITALRRDTSIAWLWKHLGLPGHASRTCKSPFRDDERASFSVWRTPEGDKWKDHGTDEGGDVVDFYAKAKDIGIGAAIGQLHALRNISLPPAASVPVNAPKASVAWRCPNVDECKALGQLRGLDPSAFDLAGHMGTLRIGEHPVTRELLWWLTDPAGRASEGRTFSGTATQATGTKVACLPGSRKDYPIGMQTSNAAYDKLNRVLMVEGSADYFAGLHMAIRVGLNFRVCAMLGANCNLCEPACALFKDRYVVIMAHNDKTGQLAAARWKEQLEVAEGTHATIQPLPTEVKDLNDMMLLPLFSCVL